MSHQLNIEGVSAYTSAKGNKVIGMYGTVINSANEIVEDNVRVHLSLNGKAKPITRRDLERLGRKKGEDLNVLVGKQAPVRPVPEEEVQPGYDTWELNLTPGVDQSVVDDLDSDDPEEAEEA